MVAGVFPGPDIPTCHEAPRVSPQMDMLTMQGGGSCCLLA